MISVGLAKELALAGLAWVPAQGDRFVIDRAGLRDQMWVLSDMVVELHDHPAGQVLGFNGTTEWALDSVDAAQALWLPAEEQLRTRLGPTFRALERLEGIGPETAAAVNGEAGFRVRLVVDGEPWTFDGPDAATAYGQALLHTLRIEAIVTV